LHHRHSTFRCLALRQRYPVALGVAVVFSLAVTRKSLEGSRESSSSDLAFLWTPSRRYSGAVISSGSLATVGPAVALPPGSLPAVEARHSPAGVTIVNTVGVAAAAMVTAIALTTIRSKFQHGCVSTLASKTQRRALTGRCSFHVPFHAQPTRGSFWKTSRASVASSPCLERTAEDSSAEDMDLSRKVDLVRSVGEECQTEPELRRLIEKKPGFVLYDGFEPSGRMHIAQGIYKTINVNKCTQAGGTFIFWVADWFALMNDKMGGDIEKIKTVGKYLIEVWKASGMDMSRVRFLWSSDEISKNAEEYWGHALDIARRTTLARVKKCCQIMGRNEDSLTAAQILYPIMQCADIFFLKADICQLGVDQRKVNMLARDYCESAGRKLKPVILSHHMLYGLKKGQSKMSKSDPDSAIFMEDSPEDVERKIQAAYCPKAPEVSSSEDDGMHLVQDDLKNPCLDYVKYILFSREGYAVEIGGRSFSDFEDLRQAFVDGEIEEAELKKCIISEINTLLEPVRQHFADDETAAELLRQVREWRRDTLVPTSSLTRLKVPFSDARPAFVVFAPLPSDYVRLSDVWSVATCLKRAPEGSAPVLWLQDWSARALGRAGGSIDCVRGYYELLLHGLRSLDPKLMEQVQVLWQGDAILSGPSEYWTSVINAGRQCSLEMVRGALPPGDGLDSASQVLSSIMHVGDVLALAGGEVPTTLCCTPSEEGQHRLSMEYLSRCELTVPELQVVEEPMLRLRSEGDGVEAEADLLVTDMQPDVNKKVKKAFCEPQNTAFCPPLAWVNTVLLPLSGEFVVARKPDNGGDKTYTTAEALDEDYASGELHPGDLKPAVGKALNALLEQVRPGLKTSTLKTAQKKLVAYVKARQKGKAK